MGSNQEIICSFMSLNHTIRPNSVIYREKTIEKDRLEVCFLYKTIDMQLEVKNETLLQTNCERADEDQKKVFRL